MSVTAHFLSDERGGFAVIFALALLPLIAAVGGAVDYSRASRERTEMQVALDMALLAGASATASQADVATKAYQAGRGGTSSDTVRFWIEAGGILRGTASAAVPTAFMQAVGISTMPASVKGAATGGGRQGHVCLLLMRPSGSGLTMNSSSTIDMPNCEVHVRSSAQGAVMINSSSSLITKRLCVAGTITLNSAQSRQSYEQGCSPVNDPFAGKLPVPAANASCTYTNVSQHAGSNPSFDPGVICGDMNFNGSGTVTFKPGLHRVRNGTINLNSSVTVVAEGVTFYLEGSNSSIQMSSSTKMTLTPSTSGPYAGISLYEPQGLTTYTNLVLNAASDAQTSGLYYVPSRNVTLNSSASVFARKLTMVAWTAIVNSSSTWKVEQADDPTKRIVMGGPTVLVD
jgi:Flp pilus assembly protein TadG